MSGRRAFEIFLRIFDLSLYTGRAMEMQANYSSRGSSRRAHERAPRTARIVLIRQYRRVGFALLLLMLATAAACRSEFTNPLDLGGEDSAAILFVAGARSFVPAIGYSWELTQSNVGTLNDPSRPEFGVDFRDNGSALAYNGSLYFMGGDVSFGDGTNEVLSSPDGYQWRVISYTAFTTASFQGRKNHASVVFDGRMWVIGGQTRLLTTSNAGTVTQAESVLASTDGITWTNVAPGCTQCPTEGEAFVFQGKLWMLEPSNGVANSRIFSTSDGVTWAVQNTNARIFARTSLVFQNRMWAIGGLGLNQPVWSSGDGVTWIRELPSVASTITGHALVFADRMWVFQELTVPDRDGLPRAALYSFDGRTWTAADSGCCQLVPPRNEFSSAVFRNRMWIIAGTGFEDGFSKPYGDAWASLGGGSGRDSGSRSDGSR
ncbi:MAG: hypothetical protein NXI24_08180 [bacterium]|nr:hypothetical protein [bacterium]